MSFAGYSLILLGFLSAAYVSVSQPVEVGWPPFFAVLGVAVAGVALVRVAAHRAARHEETLTANIAAIEASLARMAAAAEALDRDKGSLDVYDLRHRIDETFVEDLGTFADARESIAHTYGLQSYAEVMSHFAAGERHLARVWSASTDGYIDEAHDYLALARDQLAAALETFRALKQTPAT